MMRVKVEINGVRVATYTVTNESRTGADSPFGDYEIAYYREGIPTEFFEAKRIRRLARGAFVPAHQFLSNLFRRMTEHRHTLTTKERP